MISNNYLPKIKNFIHDKYYEKEKYLSELNKAENSLVEFIKQAWHVLEPSAPYIHGWHIDAMAEHLEAVTRGEIIRLLTNVPPGTMKLLSDNTLIPTPNGIKKHGDLKIGDFVFSPSGEQIKIINLSEKSIADCDIFFSNGEIIKCNKDHLWTVYDKFAHKFKTVDTNYLLNSKIKYKEKNKIRNRFFIPHQKPLMMQEKKLPLDPYFLGCWLGDGSSSKPCITHDKKDNEHILKINSKGIKVTTICKGSSQNSQVSYFTYQGIIEKIKELNLFNNKHIPEIYMLSSIDQRLELLAGLIDTDGCVNKNRAKISITTINEVFANQILRLAYSLGFYAYISKTKISDYGKYKSKNICYVISFNPCLNIPTAIPRKKTNTVFVRRMRAIIQIKISDNPEIGNCITVDSKDGLYVCGKKGIITHNSLINNVFWPAWEWGPKKLHHYRFLCASHMITLSTRDNLKMRRLVSSEWYQSRYPHVKLTKDQNAKTKFENTFTGFRESMAFGSMTGARGDRVQLDDPLSVEDAKSDAQLANAEFIFSEVIPTRLVNPEKSFIGVVMQRLDARDTSGIILSKNRGYVHLMLPMEFEPKRKCMTIIGFEDPRKEEGELLFPERFPRHVVEREKESLGVYGTAGQFQQRPSPRGGGIIKIDKLQYYLELPKNFTFILQSWDTAFKTKQENDFSCCTTWGIYNGNIYLIDRYKDKVEFPELKKMMLHCWLIHAPAVILVEDKASGQSLIQEMSRTIEDENDKNKKYKLPIKAIPCDTDKVARANAASVTLETNVYIPKNAPWLLDYLDELETFPAGAHDDQVDSTTQAILFIAKSNRPRTSHLNHFGR